MSKRKPPSTKFAKFGKALSVNFSGQKTRSQPDKGLALTAKIAYERRDIWGKFPCQGPVAQLDRASPSEGEGRVFESHRVRHIKQHDRDISRINKLYLASR